MHKAITTKQFLTNKEYFHLIGRPAQQTWADFMCWEYFFHEAEFKQFIELGSGNGTMSSYYSIMSERIGFEFKTFDIKIPKYFEGPQFYAMDVFMSKDIVADQFNHPMCLFCDDGDKPREIKTFLPYLQHGDYMVIHDYGREVSLKSVPKTVNDCNVVPYMLPLVEELGSTLRFFHIINKKI